jgi:hypothetical protein
MDHVYQVRYKQTRADELHFAGFVAVSGKVLKSFSAQGLPGIE